MKANIAPKTPANRKLLRNTKNNTENADPNAILSDVGSIIDDFLFFFLAAKINHLLVLL